MRFVRVGALGAAVEVEISVKLKLRSLLFGHLGAAEHKKYNI